MAFARPTFDALVARIAGDMRSQLLAAGKRADPLLRRSKMWVLSRVYAALYHVLYGVLEWISFQILPSTATDISYLTAFGEAFGISRLLATKATGVVTFTGVDTTPIPSGTEFVREDGFVYVTTADGEIGSSTPGEVNIAAEADVEGEDGNMDSGTTLTLSEPIAGVDSAVTWASGFDDGTDDETIEALRTRILERMAQTPQGGSAADYEIWAKQVAGVFRALAVPLARGAGTVDLYFLHTGGTGIGIPTGGQVTTVQAYIDSKRPVTADCDVLAPTEVAVDFTIDALTPDTAETRAAIEAELTSLFSSVALVEGAETIYPSQFSQAAQAAEGVTGCDIDVPAAAVTAATGEVLVLGTITWT